ncbi:MULTISPECIES: T9SS type A sorting domain-containing protein [Niastella]|uniref:T9SS type A sorting domain-containing protein n=1 Tax=Niastella soli TaxID=2821487 RepID=A0ABS3Z4U1_9BACT|nr:T9SS type A sorting domain-containing protein [Niastella soli]MBO9205187.1 T9SS type A sorting domain-containing protein [Niastella soli]
MKLKFIMLILLLATTASYAQTISEVFFPQYIQGVGNFNPADDRKVPFVCRMTLGGLTPGATYRYFNRFVLNPTSTSTGEGNYILVKDSAFVRVTAASLAAAGRYGVFTTDSTGSYTGWFAVEPNATSTYVPGSKIYFRVCLNNGANGAAVVARITNANPVSVINFSTINDSLSGTGLRCSPLRNGSARQFVFLYDNILGQFSGCRPISGTFIESDSSDNSIANGYAPFYADSVNGVNKAWGTIIPNNLPNGILHIAQYSLQDGQYARFPYLSFDGKWPSYNHTSANTKNAAGGLDNVLVINGARLSILNLWLNGEAVTNETITMEWSTPDAANAREYVVEKSIDGGKTFAPLSTVKAGNKAVYELSDNRSETTTYYRVTLLGKDGAKIASDVLSVQGIVKINVYPNPVQNSLIMQHPQAVAGATVSVVGIDGRQLFAQNIQLGASQTTLNVSKLVPGNYLIILNMNGQRQSKSFIKK